MNFLIFSMHVKYKYTSKLINKLYFLNITDLQIKMDKKLYIYGTKRGLKLAPLRLKSWLRHYIQSSYQTTR